MAVGTFTLYEKNIDDVRLNDLLGAVVKIALVDSDYVPDTSNTGHSIWSEVSADEIANGNGYSTGGYALTTDTVNAVANGFNYDSENPTWNATPSNIPAWRNAVMYVEGSLWGMTNPLIGHFLGNTAPDDIPATTAGNPLVITVPADGWFAKAQP